MKPQIFNRGETLTENAIGNWVPAIPEPYYGIKKVCICGDKFWTLDGYKGHYALRHILAL